MRVYGEGLCTSVMGQLQSAVWGRVAPHGVGGGGSRAQVTKVIVGDVKRSPASAEKMGQKVSVYVALGAAHNIIRNVRPSLPCNSFN